MTTTDGERRPVSRPLTSGRLERAALRYLERFAASAASLRRVLLARVDRSAREHGTDRAEGAAWVEALVARYLASGLLDDAVYAEGKAASLRRRGASSRAIRQHLAARGVEADTATAALRRTDERDGEDTGENGAGGADSADVAAARALARRRRLGPYRPPDLRADHRARDLAALGRAGFDYQTARRVIDEEEE